MKQLHPSLFVVIAAIVLLTTGALAQQTAPNGFYVEGNKVYDHTGEQVTFRGVNRPSLEWQSKGKYLIKEDFEAIGSSCANIVRIPLFQGFWLNNHNDYQATVDTIIAWCMEENMTVILDLHRSQKNDINHVPTTIYAHADRLSLDFWYQMAQKYKDNGQLIFELYNEPNRITDEQVLHGGTNDNRTPSTTSDDWEMSGYQELYDTIRAAGAHNLIIVGGNNWSFDLRHYETDSIIGYNIMYATHSYPIPGKFSDNWYKWSDFAQHHPIIATEFGPSTTGETEYLDELLDTLDQMEGHWVAWAWFDFNGNNLWDNFDPTTSIYDTSFYGRWYFNEAKANCEVITGSSVSHQEAHQLYPNPSMDIIHVSGITHGTRFQIYSPSGTLVTSGKTNNSGIWVDQLHNGFYFLRIRDMVLHFVKT